MHRVGSSVPPPSLQSCEHGDTRDVYTFHTCVILLYLFIGKIKSILRLRLNVSNIVFSFMPITDHA